MDEYEEAVLFTFALLESRLERLEYVLGAPQTPSEGKPRTIQDRIRRIEKSLQDLGGKSTLLGEVDELRKRIAQVWNKLKLTVCSGQTQRCSRAAR